MSQIEEQCGAWNKLIKEGTILCIDPSSGSKSSMPGFAIYKAGILKESGIIELPLGKAIAYRLQELLQCLQGEFEVPDIFVTEQIYFGMSNKSAIHLQRSIGVVMAALPCDRVIEVSPNSWRKLRPEGYVKSDENDAIMLGHVVLRKATGDEKLPLPERVLEQCIS